jgi:Fic family protein
MTAYIHESNDWPNFTWSPGRLTEKLAAVRHRQGRLLGRMEGLGFKLRSEVTLESLTEEVVKSSAIEGEVLNEDQVRSSIARHLGMDIGGPTPAERHVEGGVEMILDATEKYAEPLTDERLFGWHAALFPIGRSGLTKISVGAWRDDRSGPMQVVSGREGRQRVHYEAPTATRLAQEMEIFLNWFNAQNDLDPVLKAALAHLWFVIIHPFDDGNGRIARAITDMVLARSENCAQRFYSMSAQIRQERNAYYDILENTQKGDLDITPWFAWFLDCLDRALEGAQGASARVLKKDAFWKVSAGAQLNARQIKVLNRLLDGFEGRLTSSKWAKLARCSQDTASRDIADLIRRGILVKDAAGGRSTSYSLVEREL